MIEALTLDRVAMRRGGRLLFEHLSLSLAAGEACALTGANGAGKTSLLRAVAGLAPLESGSVGFGGLDLTEARSSGLHMVGHQDGLKPARTAREELSFWSRWCGGEAAGETEAADALGLEPLLDLEVRRLSAGQRKRLALARLIAAPAGVERAERLVEPLSPLDAGWRARFGEVMAAHLKGGGLILAAVHDPLPIAAKVLEIGAQEMAA
jgi:heme exporter protein A